MKEILRQSNRKSDMNEKVRKITICFITSIGKEVAFLVSSWGS